MYTMVGTMTDLAFAVSMMRQFISEAGPPHSIDVKHIMKYLNGTLGFKLCCGDEDIAYRGLCDAYWMGDAND